MYEMIDLFQESDDYYYIDFIPYEANDVTFLELEEYFERTYLRSFAKKITRIALKMIYRYPCEIIFTESTKIAKLKYEMPFYENIPNSTPDKLAYFINKIITKDFSSMQILFSEPQFLLSISGGFSVAIYQPTDEVLQILKMLIGQEGLFLKNKNVEDERTLV
ncbi:hypothetical protein [Lacrimispora sp.]|uniref:hypothetical protein n=1 Tax=Lacrimispora sp. TaxID=2719234 RepID=UPI0028AFF71E|nr:hypothetical protein [Lacrimispora sp.]